MISLAFALAIAAPPELPDEPAIAEEPAYDGDLDAMAEDAAPPRIQGGMTPQQLAALKRAIAKAEAERIAENAAREAATPDPWPFTGTYQPPVAIPTAAPLPDQNYGPVLDFDPGAARPYGPPADTRVTLQERLVQLLPFGWALAGAGLAFAIWRFLRPRWRTYTPIARRIITGYWREIGLFTMLAAIFVKLW